MFVNDAITSSTANFKTVRIAGAILEIKVCSL